MANWFTRRASFWSGAFYSKVRVGVGIFVATFTLIMIFRDAILNPKYRDWFLLKYAPDWSWQSWLSLGLVALLLLTLESGYSRNERERAGFRKRYRARLAELHREHQGQLANARLERLVNGTETTEAKAEEKQVVVTDAERRLFGNYTPADEPPAPARKADPILVCNRVGVIPVYWTGFKFTAEEPKKNDLYALVAEFVNRPHAKGYVVPIGWLEAQITYYDAEGEYYYRVAYGYWVEREYLNCELDAGGVAQLIIAVGHPGYHPFAVNNHKAEAVKFEEKKPFELVGERFRVQVYLSATEETAYFELNIPKGGTPTLKIVDAEEG